MGKPEHRPRRWFYVVTPFISVILTLAFIEMAFALFHPVAFSIERNMYFDPDPFTGYRLKPNSIGYFRNQIEARVNRNGHRDDWVTIDKPDDVFRILVLGDSFTVGAGVAQSETYSSVLEELYPTSGTPVQVINTGVGGWSPFQYAQYYQHYGQKFSPDLILIGFFVGNDTYTHDREVNHLPTAILGRRVSRAATSKWPTQIKVYLIEHFNLARAIFSKGPKLGHKSRRHCADFTQQFLTIQKNRLRNHRKLTESLEAETRNSINQIEAIKEIAGHVPLWVVLIPDETQINRQLQNALLAEHERDDYDFEMPQSMLKITLANASINVIDLLPHFLEDPRCLYRNDTHWIAEGHELAAQIIHRHLTESESIE